LANSEFAFHCLSSLQTNYARIPAGTNSAAPKLKDKAEPTVPNNKANIQISESTFPRRESGVPFHLQTKTLCQDFVGC